MAAPTSRVGRRQAVPATTKREELSQAEDVAEDWYLELRGKFKRGEVGQLVEADRGNTFAEAAEQFLREFPVITEGQRNKQYVEGQERRLRKYLIPFIGDKPLSQVTSGLAQDTASTGRKPSKPKPANRQRGDAPGNRGAPPSVENRDQAGDLSSLPDLSQPYRTNSKISHRAWFSPDEYKSTSKNSCLSPTCAI